jgi:hypothetical protein
MPKRQISKTLTVLSTADRVLSAPLAPTQKALNYIPNASGWVPPKKSGFVSERVGGAAKRSGAKRKVPSKRTAVSKRKVPSKRTTVTKRTAVTKRKVSSKRTRPVKK